MERKLATVLFADLIDSTRLVASIDPEVVRRRVSGFFEVVSGAIGAHGGKVEKFAGDAVMAAFGVPSTHEDDAERCSRSSRSTATPTSSAPASSRRRHWPSCRPTTRSRATTPSRWSAPPAGGRAT